MTRSFVRPGLDPSAREKLFSLAWIVVMTTPCLLAVFISPKLWSVGFLVFWIFIAWSVSRARFSRDSAPIVRPRTPDATDPLRDRELDG